MIIEKTQDLFSVDMDEYYFAHCISGDYTLGAGIAKTFAQYYNLRERLANMYPVPEDDEFANVGKALLVDNVFSLVDKPKYYNRASYEAVESTLIDMKEQCDNLGITKIAMPMIGCGRDRLDWDKVRLFIESVFDHSDIEVLICKL